MKPGNFSKMLLVTIAIGALALTASCSFLGRINKNPTLPNLVDVNTGPNYKIQMISGYPDTPLFYIKTNNTYIVATRLRTYETYRWENYWKISSNGELLDTFASSTYYKFSFAGVSFGESSYNDWPLTGDKRDKEYLQTIHSENVDKTTLDKLLSSSEQILWDDFYCYTNGESTKNFCYYLKSKSNWTLLISKEKLFNSPPAGSPQAR